MRFAAKGGQIDILKQYKKWGATDFNWAMAYAASNGHLDIVKQCKEWGATDFDQVMYNAAYNGHIEIVKLCKEWLKDAKIDFKKVLKNEYLHPDTILLTGVY